MEEINVNANSLPLLKIRTDVIYSNDVCEAGGCFECCPNKNCKVVHSCCIGEGTWQHEQLFERR